MSERKSWSSLGAVEFTASASVLAILASAGAPAPSSELIASNQRAAVSTLRSIAAAQARLRSLAEIDTDCDGRGEFGYFAELAGAMPMRVSVNCAPGHFPFRQPWFDCACHVSKCLAGIATKRPEAVRLVHR